MNHTLHVVDPPPPVLFYPGDPIEPPPNYLRLLFSLGPKYVPHQNPLKHLRHQMTALRTEFTELKRVLAWSAFFEKLKKEGKIDIPDLTIRETFPHPSAFRPTKREFSPDMMELLGGAYDRIEQVVDEQRDHVFFQLDDELKRFRPRHGIGFRLSLLEEYFTKHVIVSADKDSSSVVMSVDLYQHEVRQNMSSLHKSGAPIYNRLGDDTSNDCAHWCGEAEKWQTSLHNLFHLFMEPLSVHINKLLVKYFHTFDKPILTNFYLLAKTHKGLYLRDNQRWPSRLIVGLFKWGTTSTSKLLSMLGTILLRCDRLDDPMESPLKDTKDVLTRVLHVYDSHAPHACDIVMSSFDFEAMYTNITWHGMSEACKQWRTWYYSLFHVSNFLAKEEKEFVEFMFSMVSEEQFDAFITELPFASMAYSPTLSLAEFMLHIVVTHCVFLAPGLGIFLQKVGFAMGTNCAPTWANLVMRRFERLHKKRRPCTHNNPCYLSRFIDDGLVIHTRQNAYALRRHLNAMYPSHLKFEFTAFAQSQGIAFLDLLFVSTWPLVHTVFFKLGLLCLCNGKIGQNM